MHQPALVSVGSNMCSQMHVQDLIPTLVGAFDPYFIPAKVGINTCRYAREFFSCGYMCLS